ncbi:hypothetical protein F5J12DRAFT_819870 [Pisolithus orientalis]|uniref:uncharacterized protein n=1 Tax=Pisolithus orientalis TaxID=936130 RepID=UPI0022240B78|nr:uncharacterized protein F5J12DRAFT_819870 [Pisolithus orientalis]KAI6012708.1 hypothetical protein F5J12DRAFT_819870 [Pisolithus orientalis]
MNRCGQYVSLHLGRQTETKGISRHAEGAIPAHIYRIFYISATNFVLLLIFNIAILIMINAANIQLALANALLWLTNSYVSVIGVSCATLRFSGSEWLRARNEPLSSDMFSPKSNLHRMRDWNREGEKAVVGKWFATPHMADLGRWACNALQATHHTGGRG